MKRDVILTVIFIFCILSIIIDYNAPQIWHDTFSFFLHFFVMSMIVVYSGMFIIYLVVTKGYKSFKAFFYDDRMYQIHYAINRNRNFASEIFSVYILSFIINLCVLYFLSITPVSDVITRIPGLEMVSIKNFNSPLFGAQTLSTVQTELFILPFTTFGILILFGLKCIRRRERNLASNNYPGARILLVFCYAVLAVMIVNGSMDYEASGHDPAKFQSSNFNKNMALSTGFSLLDFVAVAVVLLVDRFVIQRGLSNKS